MSQKERKGKFGSAELPVAKKYPAQLSRRRMVLLGLVAAVVTVGAVVAFERFRGGDWATQGPLSSAHAAFGSDCANCHAPGERKVTDQKCSTCHEKFGDELGVYTHAAHYLYRSDDFRRLTAEQSESECSECHVEHKGRDAAITHVPNRRCERCHFDSLADDHPEFDFVEERIPDSDALTFPHIQHVREIMEVESLEDIERACLYCHNARPDGRSFESISFDRHCDTCHLTTTTTTPGLPVQTAVESAFGVETLEQIVDRGAPGTRWAYFTDPNEFRHRGAVVVKGPVHHRDPWILGNLRRLRTVLYPDAGLADLLPASADAPAEEVRVLYQEAIATLEDQATGLRGRPEPEIQSELRRIEELLEGLSRQIADPYAAFDESQFLLALERPNEDLSDQQRAEIETLVEDLTQPCRQCHKVGAATIARVDSDQRELLRAEFDHRAHIVQARCLDCHSEIPIQELVYESTEVELAVDNAGIQNLPAIDACRECHTPKLASDRCVTCHLFHPDKGRHSDLLLYLGAEQP